MKPVAKILCLIIYLLIFLDVVNAATIEGSIYNSDLRLEKDVLIEIDTVPAQKYLAKEGNYNFKLPLGKYTLTATKGLVTTSEPVEITTEGEFILDLFLVPDLTEEEALWKDTDEDYFSAVDNLEIADGLEWWRYLLAGVIILFLLYRVYKYRKKYGSLRIFKAKVKAEQHKSVEEHKQDLAQEPGYLERTLDIIKKSDGRITQKQLRKEMLDLSEAKISLIITELEHKGKIEKVKQGRGNVLLLK